MGANSPPTSISVRCATCTAKVAVAAKHFGRTVTCPKCRGPIDVPIPLGSDVEPAWDAPESAPAPQPTLDVGFKEDAPVAKPAPPKTPPSRSESPPVDYDYDVDDDEAVRDALPPIEPPSSQGRRAKFDGTESQRVDAGRPRSPVPKERLKDDPDDDLLGDLDSLVKESRRARAVPMPRPRRSREADQRPRSGFVAPDHVEHVNKPQKNSAWRWDVTDMPLLHGSLLMFASVVWFVGGLVFMDLFFPYPLLLFCIGLFIFGKGLLG